MTDLKLLEKKLAYYYSVLKEHESLSNKNTVLPSSTHKFQSSSWKQQSLPAFKMIKNSSPLKNSSKPLQSSSSYINVTNGGKLVPNKRTVIYNQNKYINTKPGTSSLTSSNIELSNGKIVNKRTVINGTYSNPGRKVILNTESSLRNVIAFDAPKKSSISDKNLLNEIKFLSERIKNSTDKPNVSLSYTKNVSCGKNIVNNFVVHKKVFINELANKNKPTVLKNLNENKATLTPVTVSFNSSLALRKQNGACNNFSKSSTKSHYSKFSNKYSLKKVEVQQTYSKINNLSKALDCKVEKLEDVNKINPRSQLIEQIQISNEKARKLNTNILNQHQSSSVLKTKPLSLNKMTLDKKLNIVKGSAYKLVNKKCSPTTKIKSPTSLKAKFSPVLKGKLAIGSNLKSPVKLKIKSPFISKVNKSRAIYTKINKEHIISSKNEYQLKKGFVYCNVQNTKRKNKNSKYRVINKLDLMNSNKELKEQNILEPKENPPSLDKSDSFELLDDSAIDNLEQRLLAISTSLTSTPKPVSKICLKDDKVSRVSISKINSKNFQKKTPLKKSNILSLKYKVVNKNVANKVDLRVCLKKSKYKVVNKNRSTPQRFPLKEKNGMLKSSAKKLCKKVVLSNFSIVNQHSSVNMTPVLNRKPILVKRLYKSKSTIINKNDSKISHSAKLIKSKYLALNKRKFSSFQKHDLYPKVPMRLQRYKGHFKSNGLHTKFNKYEKSALYTNRSRKFSKHHSSITSGRYLKHGCSLKQKLNGYSQTPVVVIQGTRYSLSSSGKTLRKLPSKGQTQTIKTPSRILIGGKSYVRTSENVMKVTSPASANIASRVLHRSINRVLTASTKKRLTKVNTYCMFYNRFGRCNRGVKCTYIHDPSKIAVCTRYLRGTCKNEGCPFSHEVSPGKMAICSFFLVDACDKNDCPYRHEPLSSDAVLCKAFVQGYCPNGKECKKAHILICPKFILGECEKGSSCAFPHPPQKAKKIVSKDTVNENVLKEDEQLLEKVARYFQPLCQYQPKKIQEENETIKLFVPKQRKLEEQPAFIPLSGSPD